MRALEAGPSSRQRQWLPLLTDLGASHMDPVAYDTAWVARVRTPDGLQPAFPQTLAWLREHQHADGSWGSGVDFPPDRLVATLAALVAFTELEAGGLGRLPRAATEAGLRYLHRVAPSLTPGGTEPVGFELCLPQLLAEARNLGLPVPACLHAVEAQRAEKLRRLPEGWRLRPPPSLVHSLEGWAVPPLPAGLLDVWGSCANSPSATAYHQRLAPDPAALVYLSLALNEGGARDVYPFEVFELAWVLDHFALAGYRLTSPRFAPYLDRLAAAWRPGEGAGISAAGLEPDADDTALAALTLARGGRAVSAEVLHAFERQDGFACFPFERNPSCSANIHVAYAISRLPYSGRFAALCKVLCFLADIQAPEGCWTDKWHLSPFYPTCRAVVVLHRTAPNLVAPAIGWLRAGQRRDGSWGSFGGSPEETAYAVEALVAAGAAEPASLRRASAYLERCDDRPALWVGKGLYCPRRVVDAAVAAASALARRVVP